MYGVKAKNKRRTPTLPTPSLQFFSPMASVVAATNHNYIQALKKKKVMLEFPLHLSHFNLPLIIGCMSPLELHGFHYASTRDDATSVHGMWRGKNNQPNLPI